MVFLKLRHGHKVADLQHGGEAVLGTDNSSDETGIQATERFRWSWQNPCFRWKDVSDGINEQSSGVGVRQFMILRRVWQADQIICCFKNDAAA